MLFRFFSENALNRARKYLKSDPRMIEPKYLESNGYGEVLDNNLEGWTSKIDDTTRA